jgi:hypothetical protein
MGLVMGFPAGEISKYCSALLPADMQGALHREQNFWMGMWMIPRKKRPLPLRRPTQGMKMATHRPGVARCMVAKWHQGVCYAERPMRWLLRTLLLLLWFVARLAADKWAWSAPRQGSQNVSTLAVEVAAELLPRSHVLGAAAEQECGICLWCALLVRGDESSQECATPAP